MDSENQKGLIGTIIFHGLLFLCILLMSFAGGGGGGGDNGTGEALGGIEVSLGEPDLGGPDTEAGYTVQQEESATEEPIEEQTLTEDNADSPILPSKKTETKPIKPQITIPEYKEKPKPQREVDKRSQFGKKPGSKGSGIDPGNEGNPDGSPYGNNGKGDGDGDGDGRPGSGDGDGNGDGNGPGDGPGDGPGSGAGKNVSFGLRGFRNTRPFTLDPKKSGAGTVVIKLCVDKNGSIKSVEKTLKGTMTDSYFINLALEAVRNNTYVPTGSQVSDPCGYVTFKFKVN